MDVIPKGSLVAISEGEYSDYQIHAFGEALADLDLKALEQEFSELPEEVDLARWGANRKFLRWLMVDKELITQRPVVEWHLGDYGRLESHVREDAFNYVRPT